MPALRPAIAAMEIQKIGEVARFGLGDPEVIPLWFGEGDLVTPEVVREAAVAALRAGKTFYIDKRGLPALRAAIAAYASRLHGVPVDVARVTVPGSAMMAITVAIQAIVDPGDEVIAIAPIWPNIFHAVEVAGGRVRFLRLSEGERGWELDLAALIAALDEGPVRAVFVASPSNPTGWLMPVEQQRALLAACRERGIWIIADEVYERIVYDRPVAPSFLRLIEPEDAVFVINSFSKTWAMTGWRLGWMIAPPSLGDRLGDIALVDNTGAATFVEHAGIVAIEQGEDFVATLLERCRRGRELAIQRLAAMPRVRVLEPEAAFYAFFRVEGVADDLAFAQDLVRRHKVGLAPGSAFGPGNRGFLRLCFANDPVRLSAGLDRLQAALAEID